MCLDMAHWSAGPVFRPLCGQLAARLTPLLAVRIFSRTMWLVTAARVGINPAFSGKTAMRTLVHNAGASRVTWSRMHRTFRVPSGLQDTGATRRVCPARVNPPGSRTRNRRRSRVRDFLALNLSNPQLSIMESCQSPPSFEPSSFAVDRHRDGPVPGFDVAFQVDDLLPGAQ